MQLGMAKTEARISQNYENVWDLGREWEMKKVSGKRNRKLVETQRERKKSPFLVMANFVGLWETTGIKKSFPLYFGIPINWECPGLIKFYNIYPITISGLYAGFFGRGGSIARNTFSRQLYAQSEAPPKFLELLTWELSLVEDYRQSNTTSVAWILIVKH